MSIPSFPTVTFSRDDVINQVLSSIAMEELGLSHIINAEGEKLQYVLGTLPDSPGPPEAVTVDNLLDINKSIQATLDSAAQNQMFLKAKMEKALSASVMQGPTGPPGPAGKAEVLGIQVETREEEGTAVDKDKVIIFTHRIYDGDSGITYDYATGVFSITKKGRYLINWWISTNGRGGGVAGTAVTFSLNVNGAPYSEVTAIDTTGQVVGSAFVVVGNDSPPTVITLTNVSEDAVTLGDNPVQAGMVITGWPE